MARRRRRRKSVEALDEGRDNISEELDAPGEGEDGSADEEATASTGADLDAHCLIHPTREVEVDCDDCGESLCGMCLIAVGTTSLCNRCFEGRFSAGRFRRGGWQGWAALAVALVAVGAIVGPFTLGEHPEVVELFPGGRSFFDYASKIAGAASVVLGFSAQDFSGVGRRAGMVAAAFGVLVLAAVAVFQALTVLGQAMG